jgi:hypothetical protein
MNRFKIISYLKSHATWYLRHTGQSHGSDYPPKAPILMFINRSDHVLWRIQNRVQRIRLCLMVYIKSSSADQILCGDIHKIDQIMCSEVYKIVKSCSADCIMCSDVI